MFWLGLEGRKKIAALEKEMQRLENEVEEHRLSFKRLVNHVEDYLDRINHQANRISTRQRRMGNSEPRVEYDDGVDDISKEILAMRRGK